MDFLFCLFFLFFFGEKINVCRQLLPLADELTTSLAERAAQC